MLREIPSLSRLLDVHLTVDVVKGKVTSMDHMQSITVSIPTEEYRKLTGDEVETLYLRPMVKAIANAVNKLGDVKARTMPLIENETSFLCTNGKIPVLLRVVRRPNPDRHQILMHVLVQPEKENGAKRIPTISEEV